MGRGGALLLLIMARLLDLLAVPLDDFNVPRLEDKVLRREDWRSSNVENPSSRVTPPSVNPASLACSKTEQISFTIDKVLCVNETIEESAEDYLKIVDDK